MLWRHPPRPEKEKDETKETKSKEKRNQVLDKETEKEAKRERRKPTCESASSASRRSLCRAWRREIRLDSEESWEGQNERRN